MSNRDDEIEELREERLEELRERQQDSAQEAAAEEEARQRAEAQKKAILRQYLSDDARQRLNSIRMSKPDFADQVEQQLVALAQSGRLGEQIDDDQMRELLKELSPDSRSFDIKRR